VVSNCVARPRCHSLMQAPPLLTVSGFLTWRQPRGLLLGGSHPRSLVFGVAKIDVPGRRHGVLLLRLWLLRGAGIQRRSGGREREQRRAEGTPQQTVCPRATKR
jgi:hypothetical protein